MKKITSVFLALFMVLSLSFQGLAADFQKVAVSVDKTAILETASAKANKLSTIKEGYTFTPVGSTKTYWKIEFKKKNDSTVYTGYVNKKDVEIVGAEASKVSSASTSKPKSSSSSTEKPKSSSSSTSKPKSLSSSTEKSNNKFVVFWGKTGNKVHISPDCRTIKNGVLSGSLEKCKEAGHTAGWCQVCSKGWTDKAFLKNGNPNIKETK